MTIIHEIPESRTNYISIFATSEKPVFQIGIRLLNGSQKRLRFLPLFLDQNPLVRGGVLPFPKGSTRPDKLLPDGSSRLGFGRQLFMQDFYKILGEIPILLTGRQSEKLVFLYKF